MKKRLILHIGLCKTGSTSIQNILYGNKEKLADNDICYPDFSRNNHNENISFAFLDEPWNNHFFRKRDITKDNYKQKQKEYIDRLIKWCKKDYSLFIVSFEVITWYTENEIKNILSFFREYFEVIQVLAYVREPYSFTRSFFQQVVMADVCTGGMKDYLKYTIDLRVIENYRAVRFWKNAVGKDNMIIRPFNKTALKEKGLIQDFLTSCGIQLNGTKGFENVYANESIGKNSLLLLTELNKKFPVFIDGEYNKRKGLNGPFKFFPFHILERINDENLDIDLHFTHEQADLINKELKVINKFLSDDTRIEYITGDDQEPVFHVNDNFEKEYVLDLINEYNKLLEKKSDDFIWMKNQKDNFKNTAEKHLKTIKRLELEINQLEK